MQIDNLESEAAVFVEGFEGGVGAQVGVVARRSQAIRWKSRHLGRPPLPMNLRALIVTMARENPSWGEGRIADELSLKLGLFVDARTVGKLWSAKIRSRATQPPFPADNRDATHRGPTWIGCRD